MANYRNPNMFEAAVLIIGLIVILVGYYLIYNLVALDGGIGWRAFQAIMLWMILLALIIIMAVNENIKEELKLVIEQEIEETKLLRKALSKKK